jgi:hypothetical protein
MTDYGIKAGALKLNVTKPTLRGIVAARITAAGAWIVWRWRILIGARFR